MEKKLRKTEGKWLQGKFNTRFNYLKPFEFAPKTNIGDINSNSSDDEEEGADYKVKRIRYSEWCECSKKAVICRCSSK